MNRSNYTGVAESLTKSFKDLQNLSEKALGFLVTRESTNSLFMQ